MSLHRTSLLATLCLVTLTATTNAQLVRIKYNNPGLVVDLGVGLWAWPIPVDFDKDGDNDLVVVCPDGPYNGTYFFENTQGDVQMPVFGPAKRISKAVNNVMPSYVDGTLHVMSPARVYPDFFRTGLEHSAKLSLPTNVHPLRVRANQWRYVDYDGDGNRDIVVSVGAWTDYGWDDAYNQKGQWTNGPLHGYLYLLHNNGTTARPKFGKPTKIQAGGKAVDVYGRPSPNFADFDGDGDLDLLCGEFLDGFTYFENSGSRTKPRYKTGRRLMHEGKPLVMDLEMILPIAFDWDKDGDFDLIVGDEDGRVALVEHTGKVENGVPIFLPPKYFQQQADELKFGALSTPVGVDWDGDGDQDIVSGNTAGHIAFFENLSGPGVERSKWAGPRLLKAGDKTLRIMAGPNGSIQGPCEAKWGYTTLSVADWDGDKLPDLLVNSIWGKIVWYRNVGTRNSPKLREARPIEVEWKGKAPKPTWNWWDPVGKALVSQWRTTPVGFDWNADGLMDLVMLDHEGHLAFFERKRQGDTLKLLPGQRLFCDEKGEPLRLNAGRAGRSGRRKLTVVDWDGDGKHDILVNSTNADWLRQVRTTDGKVYFRNMGKLDERNISKHTTSPTTVDWNADGVPDLLLGAEDGRMYYKRNK